MTRSIFDPTGGETERSGNRFTSPDADQISHLPTDVQDGQADGAVDSADDQTIVPANLGAAVASQPDANQSMTAADTSPGEEGAAPRTSSAGDSVERSAPGSGVE